MPTIIQPSLPKFDTTSLNVDLATKIKPTELQSVPDNNGNLRYMIKARHLEDYLLQRQVDRLI